MKTIEQRLAALEAAQVTRGRWVGTLADDLRAAALKYANMTAFCATIEDDGTRIVYCVDDAKELSESYTKEMQRLALKLLREIAIEEPRK
jgi:hypothetical protein